MTHLPDCMALEQVTPRFKDNQSARVYAVQTFAGAGPRGAFSVDGNRVLFTSQGTLGGSPAFNDYIGDYYIAWRDPDLRAWETSFTNPPDPDLIRGWIQVPRPEGITPDLSHWFEIVSSLEDYKAGLGQAFRGGLGGEFEAFSPFLAPLSGTPTGASGNVVFESRGAAADGSRMYFTPDTTITYMPDDPSPAGAGAVDNSYIAEPDAGGGPSLSLLARDRFGKAWGGNCGAMVAGGRVLNAAAGDRGAIAADGSRTYFTTRPDQPATGACDSATHRARIMVRRETPVGPEIEELFPSPAGVGDDLYEGASIDGDEVFLTTARPLVASDVDGATDLYIHDLAKPVGQRLTNISGAGSAMPSLATISGDGSRAYFTSTDVLIADAGPGGAVAQAGEDNLYLWDNEAEELSFIATTSAGSAYPVPVLGPDPSVLGVGGDGHRLFFLSNGTLTADDTDGSHTDIFRYDAEDETLTRISKAAPGGSDNGNFNVVTGDLLGHRAGLNSPHFVTFARWVSEDGETVAFKAGDGLASGDDNGITDSYIWRDGEIVRLPGTSDSFDVDAPINGLQDRPIVSLDGDSVAFQSYAQLLAGDGDTTVDVYALRVNGGFVQPSGDVGCDPLAGGCQGAGAAPAPAASATGDGGGGNAAPGVRARLAVRTPGPQARRRAARAGVIRLRVGLNRPGRVSAVAKARLRTAKGKVPRRVAAGRVRFARAGSQVLVLRLSQAAVGRLGRGERLRVQVEVRTAGVNVRTVTVPLKRGNK